jgi:feruloyl esterase
MKIRRTNFASFRYFTLRLGFAALLCAMFAGVTAWADCTPAALSALGVGNMALTSVTLIPATPPDPEYCDVKGAVVTSGGGAEAGSANFEIALPANWNQKFIFRGVGGLAGTLTPSVNPADQAQFLAKGYATAITDTGHLVANPTWEYTAPGSPDMPKIIDYYYRAVHNVTLAAKQLVKSYYRADTIHRSYFDGCSNGGRWD